MNIYANETAMSEAPDKSTELQRLGVFPYILGGIAIASNINLTGGLMLGNLLYLPLGNTVAFALGVLCIIWGLATEKSDGRKLIITGAVSIGLSLLVCIGIYSFGNASRNGAFGEMKKQIAIQKMDLLVQSIEF